MKRRIVGILVCMLLISSVFALAIQVEAHTMDKQNFVSVNRDEESSSDGQISVLNNFPKNSKTKIGSIDTNGNGGSEVLTVKIVEKVDVQEDGFLHLDITIEVSSSTLVELYKECLGVPRNDRHVDMEIPEEADRVVYIQLDEGKVDEKTIKEPVRERFYQGVKDEQKHLFGFHITDFLSNRIISDDPENELKIEVEAKAVLYIDNFEKSGSQMKMTMTSAPAENVDYFMDTQMDLTNLMVHNLSGTQIFERSIDLTFDFPEKANILDVSNYQKSYSLGDTTLNMRVETISSKKVFYHEDWKLNEWDSLETQDKIGKLFSIKYEIPSSCSSELLGAFVYNYSTESLDGEPWSWSEDFDLVHFEGCEGNVCWDVDVDLYVELSGGIYGSLSEHKIWTEFGIEAGLEVDVIITGEWSHTFDLWDYMHFSTSCHDWRGTQPLPIRVDVEPDAEVYVEVGGYVEIYINPEANFDLKVGGDLDFKWTWPFVEFHGIFDHSLGGSFDYDFSLDAYAQIKPTLGLEIGLGLFGMGLDVTPQVYLLGEIGWDSNNGAYWKAYLGCKVEIGIDVIVKEWEWDLPIDFKVGLWEGTWTPVDVTPPVTDAYIGPGIIDHVGPVSYLWFTAKDSGPEASGVDYTMFKVPEADPPYNDWQEFDPTVFYKVTTNIDEFHVQWYSVDEDGNEENHHTGTVNADIVSPSGYLSFDGWYEEVGDNTFKVKPDTVIYFLGADDAGNLPSYSQVILHFEHNDEWYTSSFSETPEGYSGLYGVTKEIFGGSGEYTVEMYVIDGVWNGALFSLTFIVDNQPPNKPVIDGPKTGNAGTSYTYTFTSTDPDGDDVSYYIWWGDGGITDWTAFQASGTSYSESHTWDEMGAYQIRAKAKDEYGAESGWAILGVVMPVNKQSAEQTRLSQQQSAIYIVLFLQFMEKGCVAAYGSLMGVDVCER